MFLTDDDYRKVRRSAFESGCTFEEALAKARELIPNLGADSFRRDVNADVRDGVLEKIVPARVGHRGNVAARYRLAGAQAPLDRAAAFAGGPARFDVTKGAP